jgi:hypothetical protein
VFQTVTVSCKGTVYKKIENEVRRCMKSKAFETRQLRYLLASGWFLVLFSRPEDEYDVPPKRPPTFTGLYDITSNKTEPFIVTVVTTQIERTEFVSKTEIKRPLARTRHRWQDHVTEAVNAGLEWIRVAEGREQQ